MSFSKYYYSMLINLINYWTEIEIIYFWVDQIKITNGNNLSNHFQNIPKYRIDQTICYL